MSASVRCRLSVAVVAATAALSGSALAETAADDPPPLFEGAGCGGRALQVCVVSLGDERAERRLETSPPPVVSTLLDLKRTAEAIGLKTAAAKWTSAERMTIDAPAVLPVADRRGRPHFVAALDRRPGEVLVVDPPRLPVWVTPETLRTKHDWDGTALYVARDVEGLRSVTTETRGRWPTALAGLGIGAAVVGLAAVAGLKRAKPPAPSEPQNSGRRIITTGNASRFPPEDGRRPT